MHRIDGQSLHCGARRKGEGRLRRLAVPTSRSTRDLAAKLGIPLTDLEKNPFLDITVDGADEFNDKFELVKGGGGALLLEKIVATSSRYMIVIADESKKVGTLGRFPLAVEVIPFGVRATAWKIERAMKICGVSGSIDLRRKEANPSRRTRATPYWTSAWAEFRTGAAG